MNAEHKRMEPADDERTIVSSRVFDAPREAVFLAFTEPAVLARWWGPKGFTNTFHEFDLRPGGLWRFDMHGPDGVQYAITKEFIEVTRPERIGLRHVHEQHGFQMTMTFDEDNGTTLLTWRIVFDAVAEAQVAREVILVANEENFDRLEVQLAERATRVTARCLADPPRRNRK